MENNIWTPTKISNFFNLKNKQKLFNYEKQGKIPLSKKKIKGSFSTKFWELNDIPEIGKQLGFLNINKNKIIFCFYTAKGGVLKTTLAYSFARTLALNGIKTLIIGLDIQCSITDITLPQKNTEILDNSIKQYPGIYQYLYENFDLNKIIIKTLIPTLDIIPETSNLNILEKKLRNEKKREFVFKEKITDALNDYDVIIYDNSPSWNMLIENALVSANNILSPIGCDIGTYISLKTNLDTLYEFQETMNLKWNNIYLLPTLLEKTKLSQQIYGSYLNELGEKLIATPIRKAVMGQEAIITRQSPIEYDPNSNLAQDYFELFNQIWKKIN